MCRMGLLLLERKECNGKRKSRKDTVLERIPVGEEVKIIISSVLFFQCCLLMIFVP